MHELRMAVATLCLVAAPPVTAQTSGPCAADARRFCQGVAPDRPHMLQCLSAHSAELSPQCKLRVQAAAGDRGERRRACQPDIQKFCKDTGHGRGHFLKCLEAHAAELSPACKRALAERQRAAKRTARPTMPPAATPQPTVAPR